MSARAGRASGLPGGNQGRWRYTHPMNATRWLILAAACALPAVAGAQWQWLDKDGRKVFSDRPPPSDIAPNRILKQPGQRAAAVEAAAPATAASAPVPQIATKDKALEEKKKQVEAAEAAKRKEAEDQQAKVRAENCSRAKEAKANFDSGVRIARTNSKGEREFLDDNQRKAELTRIEGIIARDCKA